MRRPKWVKKLAAFLLICIITLIITETFSPLIESAVKVHQEKVESITSEKFALENRHLLVDNQTGTYLSTAATYPHPFHPTIPPHTPENPLQGEFLSRQLITVSGTASFVSGATINPWGTV